MFDVSVTLFHRSGPLLFMLYQIAYRVCRHEKLPVEWEHGGNIALIKSISFYYYFVSLNKYESKYLVGGLKVLEKF